MCYESADAAIIDQAYQSPGATSPTLCTDALNGNPGPNASSLFLSDSILYAPGQTVSFPNTTVKLLFGDDDTSNAVPQGMVWQDSVSPRPPFQCLASPVAHDIPSSMAGAQAIADDIAAACH